MKLLVDFFPVLAFFISYKLLGIYPATAVLMGASVLQVGYLWFKNRRVETMPLVVLFFSLVFGSLTLLLHNDMFLKWKVTIICWVTGGVFLLGPLFGRNVLKEMLGGEAPMDEKSFARLNLAWGLFPLLMGLINLYFVYYTTTDTWVNFKVYGMTAGYLLFSLASGLYMYRHVKPEAVNKSNESA